MNVIYSLITIIFIDNIVIDIMKYGIISSIDKTALLMIGILRTYATIVAAVVALYMDVSVRVQVYSDFLNIVVQEFCNIINDDINNNYKNYKNHDDESKTLSSSLSSTTQRSGDGKTSKKKMMKKKFLADCIVVDDYIDDDSTTTVMSMTLSLSASTTAPAATTV